MQIGKVSADSWRRVARAAPLKSRSSAAAVCELGGASKSPKRRERTRKRKRWRVHALLQWSRRDLRGNTPPRSLQWPLQKTLPGFRKDKEPAVRARFLSTFSFIKQKRTHASRPLR